MPLQLARFAAIGVASTVANLVLFLALRGLMGAIAANLLALLICAVANTAANRRFTFGVRGRERAATHQFQGLVVFGDRAAAHDRRARRCSASSRPACTRPSRSR